MWARAASDSRAIIDMIAREYRPSRVYQWGSLLRPERFRDYSDIDIAVEGVADAGTFFRMLGAARADSIAELVARIEKTQRLLERIVAEYQGFEAGVDLLEDLAGGEIFVHCGSSLKIAVVPPINQHPTQRLCRDRTTSGTATWHRETATA